MTEAKWLACTDTAKMIKFLRGRASDRKLRLCACACVRQEWTTFTDPRPRTAIETAEAFADGKATSEQLKHDRLRAESFMFELAQRPNKAGESEYRICDGVRRASTEKQFTTAITELCKRFAQRPGWITATADLVRDIIGPLPFREIILDRSWLTSKVIKLANTIYEGRAHDRLPILADALMDAGCTDEDILAHCRGSGPHAHGCWVVDLLLGLS